MGHDVHRLVERAVQLARIRAIADPNAGDVNHYDLQCALEGFVPLSLQVRVRERDIGVGHST